MGLRDEILNEKEQKQQAQKEAQKEADIKQKEQLAQDVEKAKKEYKELEASLKKGVVPE